MKIFLQKAVLLPTPASQRFCKAALPLPPPPPISAFPIPTGLWGFFFRLLVSFGQFPIQGLWKASVEFQEVTAIGN